MRGPNPATLRTGFRANAIAIVGGAALILGLGLLPDLAPPSQTRLPVELAHGRIVELMPDAGQAGQPEALVLILDGPKAGQTILGYLQGPSGQLDLPDYSAGDEVVVSLSLQPDSVYVAVSDRWRMPVLLGLVALFVAAVVLVGGWRGIRSILALVLSLAAIVKVVIPLLLAGWDPVVLAVSTATLVTLATFLLTEGPRRSTAAALVGTFGSLALTAVIAAVFSALAQFTRLQSSEDLAYLAGVLGPGFDLGGLLIAAVIFGALGVLDDVTVTQAATVDELRRADPVATPAVLFGRAMNVGRSHIAATVNTLVLAYVGASLPLLVLFAVGRQSPQLIASTEQVAVEVVRALAGSIGIVAAVPLTTAIAVWLGPARRGRTAAARRVRDVERSPE